MCSAASMHWKLTNLASQIVGVDIVGGQPEYVCLLMLPIVIVQKADAVVGVDLISHGGHQTTAPAVPSISRHKIGRSLRIHSI